MKVAFPYAVPLTESEVGDYLSARSWVSHEGPAPA